jgi:hypothetical protein
MTRVFARRELTWRSAGDALALCLGGMVLAHVWPDARFPGMWRVCDRDGRMSDMVSITRAKESGVCIALAELNAQEMRPAGSPVRRTFSRKR